MSPSLLVQRHPMTFLHPRAQRTPAVLNVSERPGDLQWHPHWLENLLLPQTGVHSFNLWKYLICHINNTSPSNFFLLFHQGVEINPWWITLELVIGTDWPIPAPEAGLTKPGTTQQLVAFSSKCSPQMCCRSSATRQ